MNTTGRVEYIYWPEGFEDSTEAQKSFNPVTRYTNLPLGKYTFKAYYSRPDGTISATSEHIRLVAGLPFYFKPWFFSILFALFGLTIYTYQREKTNRFNRKRAELELAVIEKTKEILSQNEELKSQAELIKKQSDNLRLKNYQINENLDFSKLLQLNLMPSSYELHAILGNCFMMYEPKDVVSGDFYWFKGNYDEFTLIVADCTGHGVHGGFVSMMGITLLNEIFTYSPVKSPFEFIIELNKHFNETIGNELQNHGLSMAVEMEIAVCKVNRKEHNVKFASTQSPLYCFKHNGNSPDLQIFKSGGKAVGNRWFTPNITVVEVSVDRGDILIIGTDGYSDQLSETDKKRYGRKKFEKLLRENAGTGMELNQNILKESYEAWRGKTQQTDDITIIGFKI